MGSLAPVLPKRSPVWVVWNGKPYFFRTLLFVMYFSTHDQSKNIVSVKKDTFFVSLHCYKCSKILPWHRYQISLSIVFKCFWWLFQTHPQVSSSSGWLVVCQALYRCNLYEYEIELRFNFKTRQCVEKGGMNFNRLFCVCYAFTI